MLAVENVFNIHEAKTNLSSLIAKAEAGEDVVIARAGKPVVKLVRVQSAGKKRLDRRPGFMKGRNRSGPDFDKPLPKEIIDAFYGE